MASEIREELMAIQRASEDGMLHPRAAVAWAESHPQSALHAALEWDNEKAAHEHRLDQVRRLISLHIVTTDGDPVLVSLSVDRKKGGGYRDIADVVKSRDLSQIMLSDALADLERIQQKYERIKELASVWAEVKETRRRIRSDQLGASAP